MLEVGGDGAVMREETDAPPEDGGRLVEENFESGLYRHVCFVSPASSCNACGISGSTASRFSRAPRSLPGKFTTSADPRVAACARESAAIGAVRRMTSPNPGTIRSHTFMVASGVTS